MEKYSSACRLVMARAAPSSLRHHGARTPLSLPISPSTMPGPLRLLPQVCNNISKVLDAVRSRTLPVRVAAPSDSEIVDLLNYVAKKENFTLPPELAARIGERTCFAAVALRF